MRNARRPADPRIRRASRRTLADFRLKIAPAFVSDFGHLHLRPLQRLVCYSILSSGVAGNGIAIRHHVSRVRSQRNRDDAD
jgi:hypothetical protein